MMTTLPRQYSLRTLAIVIVFISLCLAADRAWRAWYVRNYVGYYVSEVTYRRVSNGDSYHDVLRHFATVRPVGSEEERATLKRVWGQNAWPIEEGDEFFHFSVPPGHGVWVQFRDGRVVNHPGRRGDLGILAQINKYPAPPIWLRLGIWPYCVLIALVGMLVMWVRSSRQPRGQMHAVPNR
jgi:hypothetical protein